MKIFKCFTRIIEASTNTVERGLKSIDNLTAVGELLTEDFLEETQFDVTQSRNARAKAMEQYNAELQDV